MARCALRASDFEYIYICMMYDVSEKIRLKSVQRYIREYEITNKLELYVGWERR